jgi:WD40 repeat protein
VATLRESDFEAREIAFDPLGETLVGLDMWGQVCFWNVKEEKVFRRLGKRRASWGEQATSMALTPNGQMVAIGFANGEVELWHVQSEKRVARFYYWGFEAANAVAFSPDGALFAASDGNLVHIIDAQTFTDLQTITTTSGIVSEVVFSPDGSRLATGGRNGTVDVWHLVAPGYFGPTTGEPMHADFAPSNDYLVLGSDGNSSIWELPSLKRIASLQMERYEQVDSIASSPSGKRIAAIVNSMRTDKKEEFLGLWDGKSGAKLGRLWTNKTVLGDGDRVEFIKDGKQVLSDGHADAFPAPRQLRLFDVETLTEVDLPTPLLALGTAFTILDVSRDGQRVVFGVVAELEKGNSEKLKFSIIVYDFQTSRRLFELPTIPPHFAAQLFEGPARMNEDGGLVAIGLQGGKIAIYDTAHSTKPLEIAGTGTLVVDLAFADGGQRLISLTNDGKITSWETRLGQKIVTLPEYGFRGTQIDMSPNSAWLCVSGSVAGAIRGGGTGGGVECNGVDIFNASVIDEQDQIKATMPGE